MEQNYLICHKEIADMGYYFLNRKQEEQYLKSINDEFAFRVGEEITRSIPEDRKDYLCSLPQEERMDFLKNNIPDIEKTVTRIRKGLLKEIKEKRRDILTRK